MDLNIRTGSRRLADHPPTMSPLYSTLMPIMFDPTMEPDEWALYDGDEPSGGPLTVTGDYEKEMRLAFKRATTPPGEVTYQLPELPAAPPPKKRAEHKERSPVKPTASVPAVVEPAQTQAVALAPSSSLDVLTAEIRTLNDFTKTSILQVGLRLKKAKALVPHGGWLAYVREQLEFTPRWAQFCMKAADLFGSNAKLTSHFDSAKFYTLMEADEEDRPLLAEQMGELDQERFAKAVEDVKATHLQAEEERQKREAAEADTAESNRKREAAEKVAKDATARVKELESRPAPAPIIQIDRVEVKVPVDNPAQAERIKRLEAEKEQQAKDLRIAEQQAVELLAAHGGVQEMKREAAKFKAEAEEARAMKARLDRPFDDRGRDIKGGFRVMEAMEPVYQPLADALGEVRIVSKVGAGGTMIEDHVRAAIPRLRELAELLEQILIERKKGNTDADFKEVD